MNTIKSPEELEAKREEIIAARQRDGAAVAVCCGTGCSASGAGSVVAALQEYLARWKLEVPVKTRITGCHGFCEQGPLVVVEPGNILYCRVKPEDVPEIVDTTLVGQEVVERLLYIDPVSGKPVPTEAEVPFYRGQRRLTMGWNGRINPDRIEDYLAVGGYRALAKALSEMSPEEVIDNIRESGLRGRGGGGFPTGRKWKLCRQATGEPKYLICNADEGDPGCFQDRSLLEGNPHLVLEGMSIAAYAIGAAQGYIYVRNEYPLAVKHAGMALEQARAWGLLGENILGSGFSFDIRLTRGGGAFVCGEETALISSIEGLSGEPNPRPRPPYPVDKGLWGKPTLINNVKTLAAVPMITERGGDWYQQIGTATSKGTMIFSLTGKVNNTGLVEVPMGMTLRQVIYEIGGGIPGGKEFKAVQTGGPAGGCLPASKLDLPLDYEKLTEAGSIMGSGGMIVMDNNTCMVDVARYFLSFTVDESCGKCTLCREGGRQMMAYLMEITAGRGKLEYLERLRELAAAMQAGSLCALGRLAPNPVLTTLRYFKDEYLAHIEERRCPAGVCRDLITYSIDTEACTACGRCIRNCPTGAISGPDKEVPLLDQELCIRCGACLDLCRFDAIVVQ